MNPQAPRLRAKIKIQKPQAPIRPVMSSSYTPRYKIAKHIHKRFEDLTSLKNVYNITNTTKFAENISK